MATHSIVFLPGEFHGQRAWQALVDGGHKESDMNERLTLSFFFFECLTLSIEPEDTSLRWYFAKIYKMPLYIYQNG